MHRSIPAIAFTLFVAVLTPCSGGAEDVYLDYGEQRSITRPADFEQITIVYSSSLAVEASVQAKDVRVGTDAFFSGDQSSLRLDAPFRANTLTVYSGSSLAVGTRAKLGVKELTLTGASQLQIAGRASANRIELTGFNVSPFYGAPPSLLLRGGTLRVADTLRLRNANLSGNGKIKGDVEQTSGSISPGGSGVGKIAINGNLKQTSDPWSGSDTLLDIDIRSREKYDRIQVKGSAKLAGPIRVTLPKKMKLKEGDSFTVLSARNGARGKLGNVTIWTRKNDGSPIYPSYSRGKFVLTPVLREHSLKLETQTFAEYYASLFDLTPQGPSLGSENMLLTQLETQLVSLGQEISSAPVTASGLYDAERWSVFVQGSGVFESQTDFNVQQDTASGTIGAAYAFNEDFRAGLYAGYSRRLASDYIPSDDSSRFGVFAVFNPYEPLYLYGLIGGASHSDQYYGLQMDALFGGAWNFRYKGLNFGPYASVQYVQVGLEDTDIYGRDQITSLRSNVGLAASYDFPFYWDTTLTPSARVAWQREYDDYPQSTFLANAGLTWAWREFSVSSFYSGTSPESGSIHSCQLSLGYNW